MPHTSALRRGRKALIGAVAATTLFALAACGDGGSSSTNRDVDQSGLDAARALVEEFSKQPTEIPNKAPIGAEVPQGKKITFLSCGTSTCNLEADIIKEATDKLGWEFSAIANDGTPEQ